MLEHLDIPTLAARRKQLKLCTLHNYVHALGCPLLVLQLDLSCRVPLVSSRHAHDLTFVEWTCSLTNIATDNWCVCYHMYVLPSVVPTLCHTIFGSAVLYKYAAVVTLSG